MIDETKHAFGLDWARYISNNSLPDWQVMARYKPYVRFVAIRRSISWGYHDPFFNYHWEQAANLHKLREEETLPVGRIAYHVLYPGEDVQRQADNYFRDLQADWDHDRTCIDAELVHGQNRNQITYAINALGEIIRSRTGLLPLLYSRYYWLRDYAIPDGLAPFEHWLAQYRNPYDYPAFTPEREPPPNPTFGHWLVTQTGDKGDADMFGIYGKHYIDRDRWNGGIDAVAEYFQFATEQEPPAEPPVEPPTEGHMYKIVMLGNMKIRKEPNSNGMVVGYALKGETHYATEEKNGWYRIEDGWISGLTQWTSITEIEPEPPVEPPQPPQTIEERLDDHERRISALEAKL